MTATFGPAHLPGITSQEALAAAIAARAQSAAALTVQECRYCLSRAPSVHDNCKCSTVCDSPECPADDRIRYGGLPGTLRDVFPVPIFEF